MTWNSFAAHLTTSITNLAAPTSPTTLASAAAPTTLSTPSLAATFETTFLLFIVYAFIGCVVQAIFIQFTVHVLKHRPYSRNFLHLPLTPIYGCGALLILCTTSFIPSPPHPLIVFITSLVICTLLELFTGQILRLIFKKNIWWDYSDHRFNFQGQICLENAFFFGLGGIIIVYFFQPAITDIGQGLSDYSRRLLFWLFFTIVLADSVYASIQNWKEARHPKIDAHLKSLQDQYQIWEKKLADIRQEYQVALDDFTQKTQARAQDLLQPKKKP